MKQIVVIGGGRLAKGLLLKLAATNFVMAEVEQKPFKIKAYDRRYMVKDVVITKPKQPNFARFQNNFKRNRR